MFVVKTERDDSEICEDYVIYRGYQTRLASDVKLSGMSSHSDHCAWSSSRSSCQDKPFH
jgi:hypothetical protein